MYIAKVPNRNSPPAILIRSYREAVRPKRGSPTSRSRSPLALRQLLKGNVDLGEAQQFEITRRTDMLRPCEQSWPRAHSRQRREREAMIVARIVEPGSKLATARGLSKQTLTSSLGECVGVEDTNEDELYDSLDWLLSRQAAIEKKLAKRHLQQGSLVLYDLTSTWVEGRSCPLAKLGYSRDGKKNKLQIVFGLLCEPTARRFGERRAPSGIPGTGPSAGAHRLLRGFAVSDSSPAATLFLLPSGRGSEKRCLCRRSQS